LEFWDPSIYRELFDLETSTFACRFSTGGTNEENEKIGQRGSGRANVIYFRNFGTPSLSQERFVIKTSHLVGILSTGGTNDTKKIGQTGSGRGHVTYF